MFKKYLAQAYKLVIVGKQKAIVAFLVGAVGSFLARHGLHADQSVLAYVQAAVVGVIAHFGVYFTRNK